MELFLIWVSHVHGGNGNTPWCSSSLHWKWVDGEQRLEGGGGGGSLCPFQWWAALACMLYTLRYTRSLCLPFPAPYSSAVFLCCIFLCLLSFCLHGAHYDSTCLCALSIPALRSVQAQWVGGGRFSGAVACHSMPHRRRLEALPEAQLQGLGLEAPLWGRRLTAVTANLTHCRPAFCQFMPPHHSSLHPFQSIQNPFLIHPPWLRNPVLTGSPSSSSSSPPHPLTDENQMKNSGS